MSYLTTQLGVIIRNTKIKLLKSCSAESFLAETISVETWNSMPIRGRFIAKIQQNSAKRLDKFAKITFCRAEMFFFVSTSELWVFLKKMLTVS